jgi:opacity protein-like surface antigen
MRVKLIEIKKLSPYLGAGVDFYFFKERARMGDTSDSTTGFHIEGGSYIALGQRFHIDLYLRYIKADAKPFDETIQLGGLRAGVGVSYSF